MVDEATLVKARRDISSLKKPYFDISIYDDASIKKFADQLVKMLREKEKAGETVEKE
jgi:hypothetical protein